jgi:hypothetical protein
VTAPRRIVSIVTGASSGIGAHIARQMAAQGRDLVLVARRRAELDALARDIQRPSGPEPIVVALDLALPGAADALLAQLPADRFQIEALVNNAGFALMGEALALSRQEQLEMIDLNVRALTDLALAVAPRLPRPGGAILNVASLAAVAPGPGMATYYATKAYVLSFSEALWEELRREGVSVTALCPGPVLTPFWTRAGASPALARMMRWTTSPEMVARAGLAAMAAGRRRVTPGFFNWATSKAAPFAPRALLLPMIHRFQKTRTAPKDD